MNPESPVETKSPTQEPTETPTKTPESTQPKKPAYRFYSVKHSSVGVTGGRYCSSTGISKAAHKAATQLFRKIPTKVEKIEFTLREVKNRSGAVQYKGKEYSFEAIRTKRDSPLTITLHGKEVNIEYTYHVKMIRNKKEKQEEAETKVESSGDSEETSSSA